MSRDPRPDPSDLRLRFSTVSFSDLLLFFPSGSAEATCDPIPGLPVPGVVLVVLGPF